MKQKENIARRTFRAAPEEGEDNQWVASSQAPPMQVTQLLSMIPYQTQNIPSYQKQKKASTRREGFTVSLLPAGPRTGGIGTRRNPIWFLHRSLSQLNGQYRAVCELYTTAILAHERTGAWAVLSVCRADKPEGRAALSAMLSPDVPSPRKTARFTAKKATAKFVFKLQRFGAGSLQGEAGSSQFRRLFETREICVEFP